MKLRFPRTTSYDLPLVLVVLALLLLGLAMVYSASGITALDANEDPGMFLAQQSAWAALGTLVAPRGGSASAGSPACNPRSSPSSRSSCI
ncbi:MAG: hypothetical protein E6J09_09095 [Chloroflexi bacterium]|nr:MAG: hypothetical protein E6J09_09095 [Chloroflexota bacterium]